MAVLTLVLEESPDSQIDILLGQFVATPAGVIAYANAAVAAATSANLSATNAGVSATSAAGSATAAATSATQAATSASNAAGSASAAATSATSAATSASLVTNAAAEVFVSGTGFTPGVTTSITLAGSYGSINNILVLFDNQIQNDCTLAGHTLTFNPNVPVGISQVVVRGGRALAIGTPADGTVTDTQVSPVAAISAAKLLYTPAVTGGVPRSVSSKLGDTVSVKDFGAKGDGVTDDTAAFNAALAAYPAVYAPAGNYVIAGSITINVAPRALFGDGPLATVLTSTTPNLPTISIPHASLAGIMLRDFSITRTVPATVGGDGINWTLVGDYGLISNVLVQKCYFGFHLGVIGFGIIENCRAEFNLNDGFRQTPVNLPSQWNFDNCLSQMNSGNGFAIASSGTGSISLGTYTNLNTFGNSGFGFAAFGTVTAPIFGIRLIGGFLGGDGNNEVHLDTYGGSHRINGTYTELCGTGGTGPGLPLGGGIPASHVGSGCSITANNNDVVISHFTAATHSANGIISFGTKTIITGPSCTGNGIALIASNQNGIYSGGGTMVINGGTLSNIIGSAFQQFGLAAADGTNLVMTGVDLSGNLTSPYSIGTNLAKATLIGNLGGETQIPTGGLVVGNATGGSGGTGTINVSSAVDLNGAPYTNP